MAETQNSPLGPLSAYQYLSNEEFIVALGFDLALAEYGVV